MSTKAQAYLPEESATELAEAIERDESPQMVVISGENGDAKPLEEIKPGDSVVSPCFQAESRIQARAIKKLKALKEIAKSGEMFYAFGTVFGALAFMLGFLTFLVLPDESKIIGISISTSAMGAASAFISAPPLARKLFRKIVRKYGIIEFPEINFGELSNANLTHEQIYEIARLGQERSVFEVKIEDVEKKLQEKNKHMKSARVLREIAQLEEQKAALLSEAQVFTDKISAVIAEGHIEGGE